MRKIIGGYGLLESVISTIAFGFLCYLNYLLFMGFIEGRLATDKSLFLFVFFDFIGISIVAFPYIAKKVNNVSNETLNTFLDLPKEDSRFTFSTMSAFLSDQALASFLITILIFTGKEVLVNYGGPITAIYVIFLFLVAITLGSVSLIRFITRFTKYHGAFYALAVFLSTGIMFAFFNVGVKLAS